MPGFDVFNQNAFSAVQLTARANNPDIVPFVPGRLGSMGLFTEEGISTTTVAIERRDGRLVLVQSRPRGADPEKNEREKRNIRNLSVPHIPMEDRIMADEIQDVRAFGSQSELQGIQEEVDQRMVVMGRSLDATLEHLRIGAVKGKVLDADGSTLVNLFTEFGVSEPTEIDFALGTDTTDVRGKCSEVIRGIEDALGNAMYTSIHSLCSAQFFDDLVNHPQVREAWERWQNGEALRMQTARRTFFYGGITFEEYRGKVGNTSFIADNKARFFPVGVQGLFVTHFAPANFMEAVNTRGLPRYVKLAPDAKYNRWVDVHMQMNPLPICTRPEVLFRARRV